MTHPQQPELSRNELGEATQKSQETHLQGEDTPGVGGNTGPTPSANQTEDERRSG